jgi:predicted transcriptional regulator
MSREEIKKMIPRGYCGIIAQNAGVSRKAVSDFLHNRSNSRNIEMKTLELLSKLSREKTELIKEII